MYFLVMRKKNLILIGILTFIQLEIFAEPIVVKGEMIKELCGKPISSIRLCNINYEPVPFQIDEITANGNYICPQGEEPNSDSSNGTLDYLDEIVFLSEDCTSKINDSTIAEKNGYTYFPIKIIQDQIIRFVFASCDPDVKLSGKRYIEYDHEKQFVKTPYYYAQFGINRFHFTKAGIFDKEKENYFNLTNQLSVTIYLRALWGLIPVHYDEDNLICIVKKYKTGPVRLIRGGNFHLNLGLGIKGSHAYVNQICYPQIVKVPVNVHVPIRFRNFFSKAYIEMCPVIKMNEKFSFAIPEANFSEKIQNGDKIDTLIPVNPNNEYMTVSNGKIGYGWILSAKINNNYIKESGFVFRRPSARNSQSIDCGYRMMIKDLPKGTYEINNWVLFSRELNQNLLNMSRIVKNPSVIITSCGSSVNSLVLNPIKTISDKK